jgi:hypothetical protein
MSEEPEKLYETVEVQVIPMRHQIGKYVLGAIATFIIAKATDRVYDVGLQSYRNWRTDSTSVE